ncbi:hypothetical protein E2G82_21200 [Salmonella enterica subsp. enterica serovar Ramatgan]|nr:hypothetical protein [Salmonella enterica subsp. enterica serovar Ramatgan]
MFKAKVNYILPDGDVVRVSLCIAKDDGGTVFQTELPVTREAGKDLEWYEKKALDTYTALICDIAADIGKAAVIGAKK